MNKALGNLFLFSTILITLILIFPKLAYASPGLTAPYYAKPTDHAVTGVSVADPGNAYDLNTGSSAKIQYDSADGSFEVKSFDTTGAPTTETIAYVDFKMRYSAESSAGAGDDRYRILYYVSTYGPVVLQDWTTNAYALDTSVWLGQSEPYDGVWNWTDISSIRFVVECDKVGGKKAQYFKEYEAWVSVYSYRKSTMWVNPASLTDPSSPFTINIDISAVDDLYGWEFKLYYDKTILTISTVTLGPLLNNTAGTVNTWGIIKDQTDNYNTTHGRVWVAQTILGNLPGATTDSGTLATLTFTVDGVGGTTSLDLVDTKLVGYESPNKRIAYMIHDATDGSVTISGVPEFPMGLALEIALVIVIIYAWRRTKRKEPKKYFGNTSLRQRTNQVKYPLH